MGFVFPGLHLRTECVYAVSRVEVQGRESFGLGWTSNVDGSRISRGFEVRVGFSQVVLKVSACRRWVIKVQGDCF